jgi:archaemetzincin
LVGQTVEIYSTCGFNQVKKQKRNVIYIHSISEEDNNSTKKQPDMNTIASHLAAYYYPMKVSILQRQKKFKFKSRMNGKIRQLFIPDIFTALKQILPSNAYCLIGVTMVDLYPHEDWNFVFGKASLQERIGVFSFARYQSSFYDPDQEEDESLLLYRSCRVCAHEIGHTFSLKHCIYYNCLMNGSNSLEESDQRCFQLCPVCLRKMQLCIDFDEVNRYNKLLEFYSQHSAVFGKEKDWLQKRLTFIMSAK